MIREITIGQYFPGDSILHRLDPRMKLILTVCFIVMLFVTSHLLGLVVSSAFVLGMYALARIPLSFVRKSLKPLLPLILFTSVVNLFFIGGGQTLVQVSFLRISEQGLHTAVFMAVRILCLIAGSSLLTYTTSPILLTDGIEQLLTPLKKLHFPVHELSMMMTIALRFIPTLIEETDKIMSAQKARGAQLDSGGLLARARAMIPVLIPLFVSAFRRAEELAMAMECRCYRGGAGRTRLNTLRYHRRDFVALSLMLILMGLMIAYNFI